MDGKSGDLNKGRTRENDPADIAHHHNPAQELLELRLMGLKEPGSEGRATDRDPGENAHIQPISQGDTPPVTDHAWPSTQCEISSSPPQMLPLCQLVFSVKQQRKATNSPGLIAQHQQPAGG